MEGVGIKNLHLKTYELNGLKFGGFEGSLRYKESAYAKLYTQQEATVLMQDFPKVDVMISHAPPAGINDEPGDPSHEGFFALRNYLETNQPRLWLHGHTYPDPERVVTNFGSTRIEYVFRHKIITF